MKQTIRLLHVVLLTVAFLSMGSTTVLAQNYTYRGNVTDESGEPLIGATIAMKGQANVATVTDIDGNFTLHAPEKQITLMVTYVGMESKNIKATQGQTIRIQMKNDEHTLGETVVVGYGQQKKVSVVGSITQTTGKVLERAGGVSNIGAALTGNLPGVVTMSSTGMPGDEDPRIVIRGVSSWTGSDPLVLVDGIQRPMSSVDIGSVKSISVLKDASATAVYGSKGANGVILITTKRGDDGKAKIEVSLNMTAKVVSKLPGTKSSADALYVRNQAIEHELGLSPDSWGKITPAEILERYRHPANLTEAERYPNVDWQHEVFRNHAMAYNPNINISGGTQAVKYFASVDFLHEGDLFRQWDNNRGYKAGYGFNRINVRSNLDFKLTKTTLLKANISGSHGVKQGPWNIAANSWAETQLWQAAYSAPSDCFLPRYSDGTWGYYPADTQGAPNSVVNLAISGVGKITKTRINTDFTLEQDLGFVLKGLKASGTISWDNAFSENERGINDLYHDTQFKWINPDTGETTYLKSIQGNTNFDFQEGIQWTTAKGKAHLDYRNLFYQAQLFWGNSFGKHNITAMGVFNRQEQTYGSDFTHFREDWAFRGTYNYDGRYFLDYSGCYNGSENFASNYRFGFFNSGAIGWLVSEEKFFKPIHQYMDMLKLRYSIGEVGDDSSGRWAYASQWAYGGNSSNGLYEEGSPYTWYKQTAVGNPNVRWATALKRNLGIDYSFLGGLLTGSLEFFNERRRDIFISGGSRSVPSYYGMTPPSANLGRTKSHGYELELRVNKVFKNKLRIWGNFSMTHAKNEIVEYEEPQLLPNYQKQTGYAIGQDHSNLTTGFANTWDDVIGTTPFNTNDNQKLPGMYDVIDYNGDGIIDSNDSAPYGYTGTPQNTYNATIGADYKGWSFMVQFYGVTNVNRTVEFKSLNKNLDTVFDEGTFWTKNTPNADAPMPRWNSTPSYYNGVRFHYDGSFIRLKNMEIAYTFKGNWLQSFGISSMRVFLNGNNLWVWSRMPDDRESNFAGTGLGSQGAYPTVKRFNLGLKMNL